MNEDKEMTDAVEILIPGDTEIVVDANRFNVAREMYAVYGADAGIVKPLVKAEYPNVGEIYAYGEKIAYAGDKTFRFIVYDYSTVSQGRRLLNDSREVRYNNISLAYAQRFVSLSGMSERTDEFYSQIILDVTRIVYRLAHQGYMFGGELGTDMHGGNFRLTTEGRIKQVGDLASFKRREPNKVYKGSYTAPLLAPKEYLSYWVGQIVQSIERNLYEFDYEMVQSVEQQVTREMEQENISASSAVHERVRFSPNAIGELAVFAGSK